MCTFFLVLLGWCLLKNGTNIAPGKVWSNTACDLCVCQEGEVMCQKVSKDKH